MTASPIHSPAREDAPHAPPLLARPLTLRAWPTATSSNDNHAAEIDWDALCEPAPVIAAPPPKRRHTHTIREIAYGFAGAVSIAIAVLCLIAR